jgi:hypothetical protein
MIATRYLDALSDRFMHRLQYRHFGNHERLTVAMTVDASGDPDPDVFRAGVRYYMLRRTLPAGAWQIDQQGTWAPADGAHRWMPSAALDADGNLAIGYSTSSTSVYPSLRYAGRLLGDPAGLAQGEATMRAGTSAQPLEASRWGDYSSLNIDPLDDCTFWYTSQFYSGNGLECGAQQAACWRTWIGRFKYPSCAAAVPGTLSGTVTNANSGLPVPGVQVAIGNGYVATSANDGSWSKALVAGTYTLSASRSGYQPVNLANAMVASGTNTVVNFTMDGAPIFEPAGYTIVDGVLGNGNGRVDPNECFELRLGVRNAGGGFATAVEGEIRVTTPAVVNLATAPWPDLVPDATAQNSLPFDISTPASYPAGRPLTVLLGLESNELARGLNYTVPVGLPNGPPIPFASTSPVVPIPPMTGETPVVRELPVTVSGFDGTIRKITAAIHVAHDFVGLVKLSLVAPDGTSVMLADVFDDGQDFGANCPAGAGDTVFDDAAPSSINSGNAPFIGSWRPEVPLAAFIGRHGSQVNGDWRLRAEHYGSIASGELRCITLTLNGYTYTPGQCNRPDPLFANSFE